MVIIYTRSELKQKTRELLLDKTALLLNNKGYLNVSSKDISRECELSQGTLFLHFHTKENLLSTIINGNIDSFERELKKRCKVIDNRETFLKHYIEVLIEHESFLSRAYKDLPYLNEHLHKNIVNIETLTKNLFFDNLRQNLGRKLNIVDSFIAIDAFIAQIQKNLMEKEIYSEFNSIIRQRRGKITKLYRALFG
ncbi:MAG: TetR/AcrR family transcriptional regulator [Candidatus Izimaplasma sp.]|nr:TetR/AcrR family transcriptional regulator [Candidatus Izimaplasma bacterium]